MLQNTGAIRKVFEKTLNVFKKRFRQRLFVHRYIVDWMDESEFNSADSTYSGIIWDYEDWGGKSSVSEEETEY
jgi:hypothetical protein